MCLLRPSFLAAAAAAMLSLGGCAARQSSLDVLNATPAQEYRGHYTRSQADGSWFRPCGATAADSAWWVTVTGGAVAQIDEAHRAGQLVDGRPSFVHWHAVLTRGGEVGPRGRTALLVREVVAVRATAPGDCATP